MSDFCARERAPRNAPGPINLHTDVASMNSTSTRNPTRRVQVGSTVIGDGNPLPVQSMTATHTQDIEDTLEQLGVPSDHGARVVFRLSALRERLQSDPALVPKSYSDNAEHSRRCACMVLTQFPSNPSLYSIREGAGTGTKVRNP